MRYNYLICCFKDSYLSEHSWVMVEKLKLYKFVIIEFVNEKYTEVDLKSWMKVDKYL